MHCDYQEETWNRFHDRELPGEERLRFEAHLPECDRCRKAVRQLGFLSESLRREYAEAAGNARLNGVEERVMARVRSPKQRILKFPTLFGDFSYSRSLAAAVMLLVMLSGLWISRDSLLNWNSPSLKPQLAQVDYFYTESKGDVVYYDIDETIKVIWVLEP